MAARRQSCTRRLRVCLIDFFAPCLDHFAEQFFGLTEPTLVTEVIRNSGCPGDQHRGRGAGYRPSRAGSFSAAAIALVTASGCSKRKFPDIRYRG
jgi:hypothetical protein